MKSDTVSGLQRWIEPKLAALPRGPDHNPRYAFLTSSLSASSLPLATLRRYVPGWVEAEIGPRD